MPVAAFAVGLFVAVFVLRQLETLPGYGITWLYDVPVALIAVVFGLRAGLAAATTAMVLFAIGDATEPIADHGAALYTNGIGYLSRAVTFYVLAVLLGAYSDRVRRVGAQFRGLLESAPDATVIIDENGDIVLANAQAQALFAYTHDELVGLSVHALVPEPSRELHLGHRPGFFADARARRMGPELECHAVTKYGREVPVEINLSPLITARGTLVSAAIRDVTESKQAQKLVRESEARLRSLIDNSPDLIGLFDTAGICRYMSPTCRTMLGWEPEEMVDRSGYDFIHPDDVGHVRERHLAWLEHPERDLPVTEHRSRRKDGSYLWVEARWVAIRDPVTRNVLELQSTDRDVTERKRTEVALRWAEERFRRAFAEAPIGMAMLDLEGRFVDVNDALCEITGYGREQLQSSSLAAVTHPEDLGAQERQIEVMLAGEINGHRSELRLVHAGGQHPVWVALQTDLLRDQDGRPLRFLAQIQDITDRRRYEQQLQYLADHDILTGLLNRRGFETQLEAHSARVERYGGAGAAIVLDLDHFKFLNDTLGHSAGDEAISLAAEVLRSRLRQTDVLARLGGDEFALLLPAADAGEAQVVAGQLLAALRSHTIDLGPHARSLAASAGIALFDPRARVTGEDVLVNADLAMYDAKNAGRDRAELYNPDSQGASGMKGRISWAQRISGALEHDGFTLLAQPIVDLSTGATSQHELLLRMRDEHTNDLIPPDSFLDIAERLGMIGEIDRWVTSQAINLLAEHRAEGEELTLEVNLSGLSLGDPELLALISRELSGTGVAARNLIFEVTETAAVINMARAGQFAHDLTRLGCRFALDDFGAGYGSFYYLKHLPFDYLKIDGGFVKSATTNETDRLLIKAAVDIATGMGKRTIAEFVGDEPTARLLTRLGVNYGQGFYLGRPGPINGAPLSQPVSWAGQDIRDSTG